MKIRKEMQNKTHRIYKIVFDSFLRWCFARALVVPQNLLCCLFSLATCHYFSKHPAIFLSELLLLVVFLEQICKNLQVLRQVKFTTSCIFSLATCSYIVRKTSIPSERRMLLHSVSHQRCMLNLTLQQLLS